MRKIICVLSLVDENIIGVNNDLVIRSPHDMKHFKETTIGKFLIMGRKTCESLPKKLPDRHSHVITENPTYEHDNMDSFGTLNIEHIRKLADDYYGNQTGDIYLIGGGGLIKSIRTYVDEVIETYFYSITVHPKIGKIVRLEPFKIKEVLSMERFLDSGAKFVPSNNRLIGGVSGRIKHYTVK